MEVYEIVKFLQVQHGAASVCVRQKLSSISEAHIRPLSHKNLKISRVGSLKTTKSNMEQLLCMSLKK